MSRTVEDIMMRQRGIHFLGKERRGHDNDEERVDRAFKIAGWIERRLGDRMSWIVINFNEMRMMLNFLISSWDQFWWRIIGIKNPWWCMSGVPTAGRERWVFNVASYIWSCCHREVIIDFISRYPYVEKGRSKIFLEVPISSWWERIIEIIAVPVVSLRWMW